MINGPRKEREEERREKKIKKQTRKRVFLSRCVKSSQKRTRNAFKVGPRGIDQQRAVARLLCNFFLVAKEILTQSLLSTKVLLLSFSPYLVLSMKLRNHNFLY
jgi:hypothetical protein